MALNTGGFAVSGSIPTIVGPTAPPVVFKYADGSTLAPNSHPEGYAQGMLAAGQSLGSALQQAAQNLNPVAQAQKRQAIAQANMQTQLTPQQQALLAAQMGRDTGQANMMGNIYGKINDAAQQQDAQQRPPMPGTQPSGPSSPMPQSQGNGLIGLNPASAATVQANTQPGTWAIDRTTGNINTPFGPRHLNMATGTIDDDPNYVKQQAMQVENTNLNAEKEADNFQKQDAVAYYPQAAAGFGMLNTIKSQIQKGTPLTNPDSVNLYNAYAQIVDPLKASRGMPASEILKNAPISDKIKTALANFDPTIGSSIIDTTTAQQMINAGTTAYGNTEKNYNVARQNAINKIKGSNIDSSQQINARFPDLPAQYRLQYGWGDQKTQKQSSSPSSGAASAKDVYQKMQDIQNKNPEWSHEQVVQAYSQGG